MIFWTVRYTNTQIQIHKYTNTACDEVPEIPNMCYIFEKPRVQGHQTWYSGLSNKHIYKYKCTYTQIQIYENTNTQIQHMTKWQKYPTYAIFLNSWWFKDVKNDNPKYSDPRYTVDFCTVPPGLSLCETHYCCSICLSPTLLLINLLQPHPPMCVWSYACICVNF